MDDSKCSISAIQTKRALLPFFQNMVAETKENMKKVAKFYPMEEVHYVETGLNPNLELNFFPSPGRSGQFHVSQLLNSLLTIL